MLKCLISYVKAKKIAKNCGAASQNQNFVAI